MQMQRTNSIVFSWISFKFKVYSPSSAPMIMCWSAIHKNSPSYIKGRNLLQWTWTKNMETVDK